MTPINLDELERLARAATPGPWEHVAVRHMQHEVHTPSDEQDAAGDATISCWHRVDAAFIAATSPSTVLSLLARLRAAEEESDGLRAAGTSLHRMLTAISVALNDAGWPSSALGVEDRACTAIRSLGAIRDTAQKLRAALKEVLHMYADEVGIKGSGMDDNYDRLRKLAEGVE